MSGKKELKNLLDEPQPGFGNYISLDLVKSAKCEHADYMFPLMRALNDTLLFVRFAQGGLHEESTMRSELLFFMLRSRQAQTIELLASFVTGITPKAPGTEKEIFKYLKARPVLFELFLALSVFQENSFVVGYYKGVRDKLVSHYDVKDGHTRKVLDALSAYAERDSTIGGTTHIRDSFPESRYFCGDIFEDISWRILQNRYDPVKYVAKRPDKTFNDQEFHEEYIAFLLGSAVAFYEFARSTLHTWIEDYELAVTSKQQDLSIERESQQL